MARHAVAISCNDKDQKKLEQLSRSRSGSRQLAERAQIILECLSGKKNEDVAIQCDTSV